MYPLQVCKLAVSRWRARAPHAPWPARAEMLCDGLADKVRRCSFANCATLCGAVPWALHCAANRLAVFRTRRSRTRLQLCTSTCAASCASRRMVSEGIASLRSNYIVGAPPHVCTSTDSVRSARSLPLPYAAESRRAVLAKPSQRASNAAQFGSQTISRFGCMLFLLFLGYFSVRWGL